MFTDNLVESRSNRLEARRVAVLPLVAGVHVIVAAALVLASVWSLRYATEPQVIHISIIPEKFPPPPGPGPKPDQSPAAANHPSQRNDQTPWEIPEDPPFIYTEEPGQADTGGRGVPGGLDIDGLGGGEFDPNGTPGGLNIPHPPEPDTGPLQIGGDVKAPVRLAPLVPVYPEMARKAGKQGIVVLRLTIDKEGRVTDVQVVSGLPFGLTQAAAEAARRLLFKPAYRVSSGKPVECYFDLSVEFRIN